MHTLRLAAFVSAGVMAAASAAAQQSPQRDLLGVSREFGGYVNPQKGAAMVSDCDAQTRAAETGIASYEQLLARFLPAAAEFRRLERDAAAADAAVAHDERGDGVQG